MRSSFLRLSGVFLIALLPQAFAQNLSWNFTGSGTPNNQPAAVASATIAVANPAAGTIAYNNASASSGYAGSSGGNNANVTAKAGALVQATSTYFEVTITAAPGVDLRVNSIAVGTFSLLSAGPTTMTVYSSHDNYVAPLHTASLGANSNWALISVSGLALTSTPGGQMTFRFFGSGGAAESATNWRIDDLSFNLTTLTAPAITQQPQSVVANVADNVTFTVGATSTAALTYEWRKNGAPIPGANTASLSLPTVTLADAGNYTVVVSTPSASLTSDTATLRFAQTITFPQPADKTYRDDPFAVTVSASSGLPVTLTVGAGNPATVSGNVVTLTGAGSVTLTATQAGDATYAAAPSLQRTFTVAKAAQTITFGALAAKTFGDAAFALTASASSTLPVTFSVVSGPASITGGNNVTLTGAGSVTIRASQIGNANYAAATPVDQTFTVAPAAATVALTPASLNQTYNASPRPVTATTTPGSLAVDLSYTGIAGTTYGPSATAPTNAGSYSVTATINHPNYAGSATGTLVVARANQTIAFPRPADRSTTSPGFTLAATATSTLPVTFAIVSGAEVATVTGAAVTLSGTAGSVTVEATQPGDTNFNAAPAVQQTFNVAVNAGPPVFTVQPAGAQAVVGESVTLSVETSSASPVTYQWRKYNSDVTGAASTQLTLANLTEADTGLYYVIATNAAGSATSDTATVYVTKKPQTIVFNASSTTATAGSSITLEVRTTSELPVTLAIVSGVATLNGNLLTGSGGEVIVRATQAGDATYQAAQVERTFTFAASGLAPFLTTKPADQTVTAGGDVTFRSSAIGTPAPTYQWQKDGVALTGATNASLSLTAVTVAQSGRYTIVATNSAGTASASAVLTVRAAPAIVTQPVSETVAAGTAVTLRVEATGTPAPTYQWRKNGTAISGATNSTFALVSPVASDSGRYDVVVTNALGSVTSAVAVLTVTTRDFTGDYFGRFSGPGGTVAGEFVLHVRANRTAVLLGLLPALQTGLVVTNLRIDPSGAFSLSTSTLDGSVASPTSEGPPIAAAPQPVTVRGTLDDTAGTVTGTIAELSLTVSGNRAVATGPAAAPAGLYEVALIGSATARGYVVVAADGQAFVITSAGSLVDGGRGTIGSNGRLAITTGTRATVDLGFNSGALTGMIRTPEGATGTLAGAIEDKLGEEHLVNLSVRTTTVQAAPLITGFVITGSGNKQVLIRAAGPAIAAAPFNVAGALADPTLQIFRGSTAIAQNDDWGAPAANVATITAATTRVGAFPFRAGSNDAAILASLPAGAYSAVIGGGNGVVLAEVYEVLGANERAGARRLINVSARGVASPGSPVIAGFVVSGPAAQRVLIRGIGPTMASAFNVAGTLPNPQLTLFRGSTPVKTNDDWFRDPEAALIRQAAVRAGAFALGANSADAAMLVYLEPGAYTAQVSGPANANQANGTGIVLVEVYEAEP